MSAEQRPVRLASWRTAGCSSHCRRVRATPVGTRAPLLIDLHDPTDHEQAGRISGERSGYEAGWAAGGVRAILALSPLLAEPKEAIRTGPLTVDLAAGLATVGDREIRMFGTEWAVLALLARRIGRIVPTGELIAALWPYGTARGNWGGRPIGQPRHALWIHVGRLRSRLGAAGALIRTVYGRGYVLLGEEAT